nr:sugar O-acetyltransferase [Vibrio coralliirubri]
MNTEREKMLTGEMYMAFETSLEEERATTKFKCYQLNQAFDSQVRERITAELIGNKTAHLESPFNCDYGCNIIVGDHFYANHGCTILDGNFVTIGESVLLAPNVVITTTGHPLDAIQRSEGYEQSLPIVIGDRVWIGANATILGGVTIGENSIVAAGAVVNKDVPPNTVVAGVPAKPIKSL